jgi:RsmE family RNA methyltransferase
VLHHIREVCRQRVGDKFEVLWGDGHAYFVEIISEKRNSSFARILEKRAVDPVPPPYLHLALCIPRPAIMDAVAEKMVELGVSSFTPVISAQSFWKTQDDVISKKIERLERIVLAHPPCQYDRGALGHMRRCGTNITEALVAQQRRVITRYTCGACAHAAGDARLAHWRKYRCLLGE